MLLADFIEFYADQGNRDDNILNENLTWQVHHAFKFSEIPTSKVKKTTKTKEFKALARLEIMKKGINKE